MIEPMTGLANSQLLPGGMVDEAKAALTLQGADLDPAEITALLGVEPHVSHRKGEPISKWRSEIRQSGIWSIEVAVKAPDEVAAALSQLLTMLPSDRDLWASLNQRYRVDVTLMIIVKAWNRGFELPAAVIEELGARGLSVTCQVYAEPQTLASGCS